MEYVEGYKPVLKNEVLVYLQPMRRLFKDYNVYVFGYGSLLSAGGWKGRGMFHTPKHKNLVECELKGFERGPYGVFGPKAYYGVIRNNNKYCNGVLAPVLSLQDWVSLMRTEMAAGLTHYVNYRVIDVTEDIYNIADPSKLKKPYKIHCVCNRPNNKVKMLETIPAPRYYDYCWRRVMAERSNTFAKTFLKTGGFKDGYEVARWIDKEAGHED